jgi:predicted GIY-YIG superfamily endonuclease
MVLFVYLLLSTSVGATVDLDNIINKSNVELHATCSNGANWIRVVHIEGFPDMQSALQFEWRFTGAITK